MLILQFRVA